MTLLSWGRRPAESLGCCPTLLPGHGAAALSDWDCSPFYSTLGGVCLIVLLWPGVLLQNFSQPSHEPQETKGAQFLLCFPLQKHLGLGETRERGVSSAGDPSPNHAARQEKCQQPGTLLCGAPEKPCLMGWHGWWRASGYGILPWKKTLEKLSVMPRKVAFRAAERRENPTSAKLVLSDSRELRGGELVLITQSGLKKTGNDLVGEVQGGQAKRKGWEQVVTTTSCLKLQHSSGLRFNRKFLQHNKLPPISWAALCAPA